MVCGGLDCFSTTQFGSARTECFTWDPWGDRQWKIYNQMNQPRTTHILADYNDNGVDTVIALGGHPAASRYTTEIIRNGKWEPFNDLPPEFEPHDSTRGCMIQYGSKVYSIFRNVTELDLNTWESRIVSMSWQEFGDTGDCAIGTDHQGYKGILALRGNFFRFETETWTSIAPPPTEMPIERYDLVTYQGVPALFGLPYCVGDPLLGECYTGTEVWKYDASVNNWTSEGYMLQDRAWHEVFEIPKEVCEAVPHPSTAALLLGGMQFCIKTKDEYECQQPSPRQGGDCPTLPHYFTPLLDGELYGCPPGKEKLVPELPDGFTFTSSVWLEDEMKVMVCGGMDCFDTVSFVDPRTSCWTWDPWGGEGWVQVPNMNHARAGFKLVTREGDVVAFGGYQSNYTSEVYRQTYWEDWFDIPMDMEPWDDPKGCIVQDGHKLYSIRRNVTELDLRTWTSTVLGDTSHVSFNGDVGNCALGTLYGSEDSKGILVTRGHWFDIGSRTWSRVVNPPITPPIESYDIDSFRGAPTLFGMPYCFQPETDHVVCGSGNDIYQYDGENDHWYRIGQMKKERQFYGYLEVPIEVCDTVAPTSPTSTRTTITTSTTSTTTITITTTKPTTTITTPTTTSTSTTTSPTTTTSTSSSSVTSTTTTTTTITSTTTQSWSSSPQTQTFNSVILLIASLLMCFM